MHRREQRRTDHNDYFRERDGVRYAGAHLLIDLIQADRLDDIPYIEQTLRACVDVSGATLLHVHLHHFTPDGGVSGVAVLAESHISIHTWPEHNYAAVDVFMCGETEPHKAIDVLRARFAPERVIVNEHLRGKESDLWTTGSTKRCTADSASA
ncbi:MAG: adenosylmethionine decarboxylase [Methyloligellaceae bacterium]